MFETTQMQCQFCRVPMTLQRSRQSPERYYHCSTCGRWVASTYDRDALRTGTVRRASEEEAREAGEFEKIKERMARWMAGLDQADPYRVLGVSPSARDEAVRSRFTELAMKHHPDHGGDPSQMRTVLSAYERIRRGRRALMTA